VCATLWAVTALATPSPDQACNSALVTAWKVYTSCIDGVVAKDVNGDDFDEFAAFAKCRHAYFKKWTGFQRKASLAGTACVGSRYTDNGDGTVTDNLTTLVWEKKDNQDDTVNAADPHDADNGYTWGTTDINKVEDGSAFTTFLTDPTTGLNVTGFAGAYGWRLPTLAELETIVLDFSCTGLGRSPTCQCGSVPCIDAMFGPTQGNYYWSATIYLPINRPWYVSFANGSQYSDSNSANDPVRAVRGGL